MTPAMDVKGLEALARAYDREDSAQRGEPDPWTDTDGADDSQWQAERISCASAAISAYLAATLPPDVAGLVAEWEKAEEGVTPGPWRPSSFGFQVVSDFPEAAWQSVVELRTIARSTPHTKNEMESQRTIAAWIARSSPAGIRVLLDTIKAQATALTALSAREAKMRGALEPFADLDGEGDEDFGDDEPVVIKFGRTSAFTVKLGDLRRARLASDQTGAE